ncbi:MAG TPA: hypothetical protein VFU99_09360 [Gaiellaceae bacterium]|nr:hypothetical protein [Gaiellaceae bacterium]
MTQHVRRSYRRHRRAAWLVALALGVVVAAVSIPLAIGAAAADKTYKLTLSPTTTTCASPATTKVTIKNTGSPQTLGSAEIYFPPNTVASAPGTTLRTNKTSTSSNGPKDILVLENVGLVPGASKEINVTFNTGVTFSATINAVAKQSNRFNDSGGDANLFSHEGSFPTLKVVRCVTVSGRVYQDRNLDNGYVTGDGAFNNSDIPKAWTVKLYSKDVGADVSTYQLVEAVTAGSPTSSDPGAYAFSNVPTLSDYKVCVSVPSGDPDNASKWGLQKPVGNTQCGPISTALNGPTSSAAKLLPNLAANASSTSTDFLVVPVVGPVGPNTPATNVDGYIVDPASNSTKLNAFYVQDVWVDEDGRTNFRFSPIVKCGDPGGAPASECSNQIILLETLTADIDLDDLAGQQATLYYDDEPPFLDGDLKPMPYCLIDPVAGQPSGELADPDDVLGKNFDNTDATSCIVSGQQTVTAGTGTVHAVFRVYTAYDGGRQIG